MPHLFDPYNPEWTQVWSILPGPLCGIHDHAVDPEFVLLLGVPRHFVPAYSSNQSFDHDCPSCRLGSCTDLHGIFVRVSVLQHPPSNVDCVLFCRHLLHHDQRFGADLQRRGAICLVYPPYLLLLPHPQGRNHAIKQSEWPLPLALG